MTSAASSYPVTFEVEAPAPQGRLSVLLRAFYIIPHLIVLAFLNLAFEIITFIAWFAILFTGRYPRSFASFAAGVLRWGARVNAYYWLLTGRYPPFSLEDDPAYPVRVTIDVQTEGRNRLTAFFRILVAIPHLVVLWVVAVIGTIVLLLAWVIALFTGSVPGGLHSFMAGVNRWSLRLNAYLALLTDRYPPFSLS